MTTRIASILLLAFVGIAGQAKSADLVIGDSPTNEAYTIAVGETLDMTGDRAGTIYLVNNGTLSVQGTLILEGSLIALDTASVVVEGGTFHILGDNTHIALAEQSVMAFQNNAILHYTQTYLAQHIILLSGSAQMRLTDSTVDCDRSAETIVMTGSSSYAATNVSAPDWKTWYLSDTTTLALDGMNIGGDIVFSGSPVITCANSVGIMPWLYFGDGAVVDYAFPDTSNPAAPVTLTISDQVEGFDNIPWTFTVTNSRSVLLGIQPAKGSNVTVRDSYLGQILYRFDGPGEGTMSGVMQARTHYDDETIPVTDRTLRLVNTTVKWWKVDVVNGYDLTADHLVFSEMMVKGASRARLSDSICEGQTIHLGAQDQAYVEFSRGEVWSDVSAWGDSILILRDSLVDYTKGEYIYQIRNIAHNNARFYSLNTTFAYQSDPAETEPEAMDAALAMYLRLTPPAQIAPGTVLGVPGSAWIKTGTACAATFDHYTLEVAPANSMDPTLIATGFAPLRQSVLGTWDTAGLAQGDYTLRLTLWTANDGSTYPPNGYPAETTVKIGCANAADCPDTNPCTADTCVDSKCQHTVILGCCLDSAECDDGNPCTIDACSDNKCLNDEISGCCVDALECDDGDPCTIDVCADTQLCAHEQIPDCPPANASDGCSCASNRKDDDAVTILLLLFVSLISLRKYSQ